MELRETLFTKSFSAESTDPYKLSTEFMHRLAEIGKIYEKKNIYETDGPVKKAVMIFDLVEDLDSFSKIIIGFSLESENETLYVDITGEFVLRISDMGFFTEVFTDFYLQNVFPVLRKVSERRVDDLNKHIERI